MMQQQQPTHLEQTINDGVIKRTPMSEGYILMTQRGVFYYNFDGVLHRTDGPAAEYVARGRCVARREWHVQGKLHRVDAPAVEYADGTWAYWVDGERHCETGPAVVYPNGDRGWYSHGRYMTEAAFVEMLKIEQETREFFSQNA